MRLSLPFILALVVVTFAGCNRAPHFQFTDQTQISFTNLLTLRDGIVLGPRAKASFIQAVSQPESKFDPELLRKSAPAGLFLAGDSKFEYHLEVVIYRDGSKVHIWDSDFCRQLLQADLSESNGSWKEILAK